MNNENLTDDFDLETYTPDTLCHLPLKVLNLIYEALNSKSYQAFLGVCNYTDNTRGLDLVCYNAPSNRFRIYIKALPLVDEWEYSLWFFSRKLPGKEEYSFQDNDEKSFNSQWILDYIDRLEKINP